MPPGNKLFAWGKLWVRSNKDSLEWRSSREPPSSSNNDSSLRMRLWRRSSPILPLHKAMRLRVFTVVTGFWFSRLSWSLEEVKMGIGQIKMPHNSLFLLRFNLFFFFFCINSPFIVANFWLISKLPKSLILIVFAAYSLLVKDCTFPPLCYFCWCQFDFWQAYKIVYLPL